jgi:hypothetical protein
MNASRRIWGQGARVAGCATIAMLFVMCATVGAQRPADPQSSTVTGVIERFTTAPRGEVDGAVLSDGTLVHWPPRIGDQMSETVSQGDRIQVVGGMETGPAGDHHFEAQSVTNIRTNAVVNVADIGPPAPPPRGRGPRAAVGRDNGAMKTVRGTIDRFTTAPRGEVDGAVLSDGSVIHWPPHLENRFAALADKGSEVRATSWVETGPEGDTHLEVQTLTNARSNESATNDDAPPPRPARPLAKDRSSNLDQRLRDLQAQLDQIQREIDRLRNER